MYIVHHECTIDIPTTAPTHFDRLRFAAVTVRVSRSRQLNHFVWMRQIAILSAVARNSFPSSSLNIHGLSFLYMDSTNKSIQSCLDFVP